MAPELSARVVEVRALAEGLWFLPRPARAPIADKLHGLGYRRHPELATLTIETAGPKQFANVAPQHVVAIKREEGLGFLRGAAAQTGDSDLADLADRIEAADTEEKRAAERERLAATIPESLRVIEERLGSAKPEDLG